MKRYATKKRKTFYALFLKATNDIIISSTKVFIASILDIHVITITRNMKNKSKYETDEFIIWKNVPAHIGKARGRMKGVY